MSFFIFPCMCIYAISISDTEMLRWSFQQETVHVPHFLGIWKREILQERPEALMVKRIPGSVNVRNPMKYLLPVVTVIRLFRKAPRCARNSTPLLSLRCAVPGSSPEIPEIPGAQGGAVGSRMECISFSYNIYWLVVWNMAFMTFHILGMSSSQLTNSYFQRGGSTTNQIPINPQEAGPFQFTTCLYPFGGCPQCWAMQPNISGKLARK